MSTNIAKDLPFRGPTCPRCGELCPRDSIRCSECGSRLVPLPSTIERVRAAIAFTSRDVDPDEHAAAVVAVVEEGRGRHRKDAA